jgi:hypothetical protein
MSRIKGLEADTGAKMDQLRIEPLDSVLKLDTGEFSLCGSMIRPSVRRMARSNSHEPHRVLGYFDSPTRSADELEDLRNLAVHFNRWATQELKKQKTRVLVGTLGA